MLETFDAMAIRLWNGPTSQSNRAKVLEFAHSLREEMAKGQEPATWQHPYAAPAAPDGMVLVPEEPTKAMRSAFYDSQILNGVGFTDTGFVENYKAMIAAAKEGE